MPRREARGSIWQEDGRWRGRLDDPAAEVSHESREGCLAKLRRKAGRDVALTVEVLPSLVGVAEAASIMGWDKRRVATYVRRGSFPEPMASLASGRVWRRDDVETFASEWRARRKKRVGR